VAGLFYCILFLKSSPLAYYAYAAFPIYFWSNILTEFGWMYEVIRKMSADLGPNLFKIFLYLAGLELLVFSYHYREILSLCFVALFFWPLALPAFSKDQRSESASGLAWSICCAVMAIFPLLSVEMHLNITL
jgi:GPI ethanolamine phosphate transferase 1